MVGGKGAERQGGGGRGERRYCGLEDGPTPASKPDWSRSQTLAAVPGIELWLRAMAEGSDQGRKTWGQSRRGNGRQISEGGWML